MPAFSFRQTLCAALLGMGLAASAAPTAPATVVFDTVPRPGQHQQQRLEIQATMKARVEAAPDATDEQRAKVAQLAERMAMAGTMKMTMKSVQTSQVGQPDADGWLPLTVTSSAQGATMEVGGQSVPMPQPQQNLGFTARFNPQDFSFELLKADGSAELTEFMRTKGSAMVSELMQMSKAMNQRPMKVGDSFEVPLTMALPVPMPGGQGSLGSLLRYTLSRVERGVAHFDLGMDLKLDAAVPVPAAAASAPEAASAPVASPPPAKLAVVGTGKGSSSLRMADRLPLAGRLKMEMKMTIDMPENARMLMDVDMLVLTQGESLAKPAAAAKPTPKKKS